MTQDVALLKSVPIFAELAEDQRAALAVELEEVAISAGDYLCEYGDPGDSMFIVREGTLEVSIRNDTGEEIVLEECGPGGFIGEISLLDPGPRTASLRAVSDVEALVLSREHLDHFLRERPDAAAAMLSIMGRRLRRAGEKLRHTATRNVNVEAEDLRTPVQKGADWIAEFAGSIAFVVLHAIFFTVWLAWNSIPGIWHFDTEGFPLLTMIVSLEAIFLSTFVLLSANRQAEKDRVRGDIEYDVNLKAEQEVAHLHVKLDRLHAEVLERLGDTAPRAAPVPPPLWARISALAGRTLATAGGHAFRVLEVTEDEVRYLPTRARRPRTIPRSRLEGKPAPRAEPADRDAPYVAAILANAAVAP